MKYTFFIRMSGLHAMPIINITHSACYAVEMGVNTGDLTRITLDSNHKAYKHICLQGIGCVCVSKNYPPEIFCENILLRFLRRGHADDGCSCKFNLFLKTFKFCIFSSSLKTNNTIYWFQCKFTSTENMIQYQVWWLITKRHAIPNPTIGI